MSNRMNAKLRPEGEGTRWEDSSHAVPSGLDEQEAVDLFAECLQVFFAAGKPAKEVAFELGLSESHLSEMRAGKRSVTLVRLLRLCRRNQDAALVLGRRLAVVADLDGPRRKRRVTKRDVEKQMTLQLRRMSGLFELVRRETAAQLGADESDIDDALDEPTGIRRFDEVVEG